MDSLAVIESDPATFADIIKAAALHDDTDEASQEMFVRIEDNCVETPASGTGARRTSYCTLSAEWFESLSVAVTGSVDAMFDIDTVLGWLQWFDGDGLTARFEGQAGIATRLTLESGDDRVSVACVDDPAVLNGIDTLLPARFDGATFLDEDGTPMPTTVETSAAELARLVRAIEITDTSEEYPLTIRDRRLTIDIETEHASVSAPLDADVEGAAVTNYYGDGFAEVVRGIDGDVTLQTGPGEAVAFVQDRDFHTLRFVVSHA